MKAIWLISNGVHNIFLTQKENSMQFIQLKLQRTKSELEGENIPVIRMFRKQLL